MKPRRRPPKIVRRPSRDGARQMQSVLCFYMCVRSGHIPLFVVV
jgi:hypothetical protein